jgi:hypothetical protein
MEGRDAAEAISVTPSLLVLGTLDQQLPPVPFSLALPHTAALHCSGDRPLISVRTERNEEEGARS